MNRRRFLASMLVTAVNPMPSAMAALDPTAPVVGGDLNAAELGMNPGASADQSRILQRLLDAASASNHQIYLPAGSYAVSEVKLPPRTRLAGVPGATRLVFAGGASMFTAERAEVIQLSGLTVDGADLPLDEYVPGIVHLADCRGVDISGCTFVGSSRAGLALDRCEGRIRSNALTTARDAAIRAVESTGLSIVDNTIADCGN